MSIAETKICQNCRHFARLAQRNSIKLFDRTCAKCEKEIKTSYSPERSEVIYCKQCYNQEVA